jgi:two-component system sensor histidine kinase AlgZ
MMVHDYNSTFRSLKWKLSRPGYWAAFIGMVLAFVGMDLWTKFKNETLLINIELISIFLTPVMYFSGMVWFSAIPWQFNSTDINKKFTWLKSFIFSGIYMIFMISIDAMVCILTNKQTNFKVLLPSHILFHAPAMMLVGNVIATRERLGAANESLMLQAREAQTRALQGQLHPHVLFNALNGLAELIHKNADQAEDSVRHLSDLLRKVLAATDDPAYSLRHERNILEHYLDMEGLRLGKRLTLGWDWDRSMEQFKLPPLLLQPLVENAIKHGVAPCREGGEVRIQARREGTEAVLCVRNTGMPLGPHGDRKGTAIGLSNLRSRLALSFNGTARFSLKSDQGWTVAEVRLPWLGSLNPEELHECA